MVVKLFVFLQPQPTLSFYNGTFSPIKKGGEQELQSFELFFLWNMEETEEGRNQLMLNFQRRQSGY